MKEGKPMAAPKNTLEVISVLEREYCTECKSACIDCPLLGPLKVLEGWQEEREAQTKISVDSSPVTSSWRTSVKPLTAG